MQTNTHRIFPYKCMVMQSYSTSFTIPYKAGTINLVTENKTAKLLFYFGHMADHRVWYGNVLDCTLRNMQTVICTV